MTIIRITQKIIEVREERSLLKGWKLLHTAYDGDTRMVQTLLNHGADPKLKNMQGRTPFNLAVSEGHTNVARVYSKRRKKKEKEKNVTELEGRII